MKRIYKYSIPIEDYFSLDFPKDSVVLSVQEQYGKPYIWVLSDFRTPGKTWNFHMIMTGQLITKDTKDLKYIGTFQILDGEFVGHLFEII